MIHGTEFTRNRSIATLLRFFVALILAFAAATSIVGKPLIFFTGTLSSWWTVLTLSIILLLIQFGIYLFDGRFKKQSVLVEGDDEFLKFFEDWYSNAITLKMRCNNLAWLEGVNNAKILAQVKRVGPGAEIYCNNSSSPVSTELESAGVTLVKDWSTSPIRFSLKTIGPDDESEVIIRSKFKNATSNRSQNKKIWVQKFEDNYQCELIRQYLSSLLRLAELPPNDEP